MSYGYIYLVTNLINGKTYVGQRRSHRDSDWNEYFGSGKLIRAAIELHGKESFRKDLLTYAESQDELDELESSFIEAEWKANRGEYNLRAFVPSPNSWTALPSGKLVEKMDKWRESRRLSDSLKDPKLNHSHLRAKARWEAFLERTKDCDFEDLYKKLRSAKMVADKLNESRHHVTKILKSLNIEMTSRREFGHKSSEENNLNIQKGVREKLGIDLCKQCFPSSDGPLCKNHQAVFKEGKIQSAEVNGNGFLEFFYLSDAQEDNVLSSFRELKSMRATAKVTGFTSNVVKKVLLKNEVEIPKQNTNFARAKRGAR